MNKDQKTQLDRLVWLEQSLFEQIKAIKTSFQSIHREVNEESQWQGTSPEVDEHRLSVLAVLSRIHNELNTLTHPVMSLRGSVSERYVPDETALKSYESGYETGMNWKDHWNHRPGGPSTFTQSATRGVSVEEATLANRREKHRTEQWFKGFDDALNKKSELGIYVPTKAKARGHL